MVRPSDEKADEAVQMVSRSSKPCPALAHLLTSRLCIRSQVLNNVPIADALAASTPTQIRKELTDFFSAPRGGVTLPGIFITLLPKYLEDNQVQKIEEVRADQTLGLAKAAWFDEYQDVLPDFRIPVLEAWASGVGMPMPNVVTPSLRPSPAAPLCQRRAMGPGFVV